MAWAMVVGAKGGRPLIHGWLRLWRPLAEPHTMETGWTTFAEAGPKVWSLSRLGVPPRLEPRSTEPTEVCGAKSAWRGGQIELSNWNWKVVRQFLKQSFDLGLSRSSCLNYLHRLGFVLKRPKKRLLKAKDEERKAFVLQYRWVNPRGGPREWRPRSSSWMKPTFGPMPTCEANGYSRERQRWWTPPVPGGERRPATTREFDWPLGRWKPWK